MCEIAHAPHALLFSVDGALCFLIEERSDHKPRIPEIEFAYPQGRAASEGELDLLS